MPGAAELQTQCPFEQLLQIYRTPYAALQLRPMYKQGTQIRAKIVKKKKKKVPHLPHNQKLAPQNQIFQLVNSA